MECQIIPASSEHWQDLVRMAYSLWPDNSIEELEDEFTSLVKSAKDQIYIAKCLGDCVGFVHVSLREDYVEGSDSSPVGYLEGIYVKPSYRRQGIGKKLTAKAESWAALKGCSQFASDTELENKQSIHFHRQVGFCEANRLVCFIKKL